MTSFSDFRSLFFLFFGSFTLLANFSGTARASAVYQSSTNQIDPDGRPNIVVSGNPDDPLYSNDKTGVGFLFIPIRNGGGSGFICSGSLIGDKSVLTAAHCFDAPPGQQLENPIFFLQGNLADPSYRFQSSGPANIHPLYTQTVDFLGAFALGDIAIVPLQKSPLETIPGVEKYEIYTGNSMRKIAQHYGFGSTGTGQTGATRLDLKGRTGLNRYETTLEPFFGNALFADQILYDFDSGKAKNDAISWWLGGNFKCSQGNKTVCTSTRDGKLIDLGEGSQEVSIAPGDSGGPAFIDGKIAGIHSFGFTYLCQSDDYDRLSYGPDETCFLDSSYGEVAGDTRVAAYKDWIDGILNGDARVPSQNSTTFDWTTFNLDSEARSFLAASNVSRRSREVNLGVSVPEPGSVFGILVLGLLGAGLSLVRERSLSKTAGKETE